MVSTGRPWPRGARWAGWALFGVLLALEVLAMGATGLQKFNSMEGWMYWFSLFGYPPQFSLVVGALEFVGAGLLLIPRLASYAAGGLAVIMVGALHAVLTHETDLGWGAPLMHLALLAVIGGVQWRRRWRP